MLLGNKNYMTKWKRINNSDRKRARRGLVRLMIPGFMGTTYSKKEKRLKLVIHKV